MKKAHFTEEMAYEILTDAYLAVQPDQDREAVKNTIKRFIHHDCNKPERPSVLGFKVKGLKNKFFIWNINYEEKTIEVELCNSSPGKTYSEEDLV